jgi:hypothetical protein
MIYSNKTLFCFIALLIASIAISAVFSSEVQLPLSLSERLSLVSRAKSGELESTPSNQTEFSVLDSPKAVFTPDQINQLREKFTPLVPGPESPETNEFSTAAVDLTGFAITSQVTKALPTTPLTVGTAYSFTVKLMKSKPADTTYTPTAVTTADGTVAISFNLVSVPSSGLVVHSQIDIACGAQADASTYPDTTLPQVIQGTCLNLAFDMHNLWGSTSCIYNSSAKTFAVTFVPYVRFDEQYFGLVTSYVLDKNNNAIYTSSKDPALDEVSFQMPTYGQLTVQPVKRGSDNVSIVNFEPSPIDLVLNYNDIDAYGNYLPQAQKIPTAFYLSAAAVSSSDVVFTPAGGPYDAAIRSSNSQWSTSTQASAFQPECVTTRTRAVFNVKSSGEILIPLLLLNGQTLFQFSPTLIIIGPERPVLSYLVTTISPSAGSFLFQTHGITAKMMDSAGNQFSKYGTGAGKVQSPTVNDIHITSTAPNGDISSCPVPVCDAAGCCDSQGYCRFAIPETYQAVGGYQCSYDIFRTVGVDENFNMLEATYSFTTTQIPSGYSYKCLFGSSTTPVSCDDDGLAAAICNSGNDNTCSIGVQKICADPTTGAASDSEFCTPTTTKYNSGDTINPSISTCSGQQFDAKCQFNFNYQCQFTDSLAFVPCTQAGLANLFCNSDQSSICTKTVTKVECYADNDPAGSIDRCAGKAVDSLYVVDEVVLLPTNCGPNAGVVTCRVRASPTLSTFLAPASFTATNAQKVFVLTLKDSNGDEITTETDSVIDLRLVPSEEFSAPCSNLNYCTTGVKQSNSEHYQITLSEYQTEVAREYTFICSIDGVECANVHGKTLTVLPGGPDALSSLEYQGGLDSQVKFYDTLNAANAEQYYVESVPMNVDFTFIIRMEDEFGNFANTPADSIKVELLGKDTLLHAVFSCTPAGASDLTQTQNQSTLTADEYFVNTSTKCVWDTKEMIYVITVNMRRVDHITLVVSYGDDTASKYFNTVAGAFASVQTDNTVTYTVPEGQPAELLPIATVYATDVANVITFTTPARDEAGNSLVVYPYAKVQEGSDELSYPADFTSIEVVVDAVKYPNFDVETDLKIGDISVVLGSVNQLSVTFETNLIVEFDFYFLLNNLRTISGKVKYNALQPTLASDKPDVSEQYVKTSAGHSFVDTITFSLFDMFGNPSTEDSFPIDGVTVDGEACIAPVCQDTENCCQNGACTLIVEYQVVQTETTCTYTLPYKKQSDSTNDVTFMVVMANEVPTEYEYRCTIEVKSNNLVTAFDKILIPCTPTDLAEAFCSSQHNVCNISKVNRVCFESFAEVVVEDGLCDGKDAGNLQAGDATLSQCSSNQDDAPQDLVCAKPEGGENNSVGSIGGIVFALLSVIVAILF